MFSRNYINRAARKVLPKRPLAIAGISGVIILFVAILPLMLSCAVTESPADQQIETRIIPNLEFTPYAKNDELTGNTIQLSDLRGNPIVLNFWAGLCPPCRAEMPAFQEIYRKYKTSVVFLGIDIGPFTGLGTRTDGKALMDELGITYPMGSTFDQTTISAFQIYGVPTTLFIDSEGRIVTKWTGFLTKSRLESLVKSLLEQTGSS